MEYNREQTIKFGIEEDKLFRLLDPAVCEYRRAGEPFILRETDPAGKAAVTVESDCPCFAISSLDTKGTLSFFKKGWDEVTKCADHVVFLFDRESGRWSVHIFELKLSLDKKKWKNKILKQFSGAMIRACAIAGVMRIPDFARIYLHCCYCEKDAGPAERHTFLGKPVQEDYLKEQIQLAVYPNLPTENAPLKMERKKPNDEGCARIRLTQHGCTVLPPEG